jgi:hypothetical protein
MPENTQSSPNGFVTAPDFVTDVKNFKEIDASIQRAESFRSVPRDSQKDYGRKMSLVRTKLQEAKMWAGKVLEAIGNPFPAELADKANVQ